MAVGRDRTSHSESVIVLVSVAVMTAFTMAAGARAASISRIVLIVPGRAATGGVMPALVVLARPTVTAAASGQSVPHLDRNDGVRRVSAAVMRPTNDSVTPRRVANAHRSSAGREES